MDLDANMNVIDDLTLNISAPDVATCQMLEGSIYSFARESLVDILDKALVEENINENFEIDSLTIDVDGIDKNDVLSQLAEKLPSALKAGLAKAVFKKRSGSTVSMLTEIYRRMLPMEKTFNLEKIFENYVDEWFRQNPGAKFDALVISEYIIKIMMREYPNLDSRQIAYTVYKQIKQIEADSRKKAKRLDSFNEVADAGIVLLSPYIPVLFNRLGTVVGNFFASEDMRLKSLAILYYAVFGDFRPPEMHSLLMNIFCVFEQNFVCKELPSLTDDEKGMVNGLLDAVVKNWGAIGKTSADGLRSGFLIRKGTLKVEEGFVKLKVTQNAYDMLLDKLPWGYSMVKFPWMKSRIDVEWR